MLPRVVQVVLGIIGSLALGQAIYGLYVVRVHKVAEMRGESIEAVADWILEWPTIWNALLLTCVCFAGLGIIEAIAIHGKRLENCLAQRDEE